MDVRTHLEGEEEADLNVDVLGLGLLLGVVVVGVVSK